MAAQGCRPITSPTLLNSLRLGNQLSLLQNTFPPPLTGGGEGAGELASMRVKLKFHPHPNPPPSRGRGHVWHFAEEP